MLACIIWTGQSNNGYGYTGGPGNPVAAWSSMLGASGAPVWYQGPMEFLESLSPPVWVDGWRNWVVVAAKDAGSNDNWIDALTSKKQRQADSRLLPSDGCMSRPTLESAPALGEGSVPLVYSP